MTYRAVLFACELQKKEPLTVNITLIRKGNYMSFIPYYKSEKIADGSYKIWNAFIPESPSMYCYLVEGSERALLIDTMMGAGDLRAYCATLTDKPVKVVNTHAHPDHVLGNFFFGECYIHHRDIAALQEFASVTREQLFEWARQSALPEYRDALELDENFADIKPIRVCPLYGGDMFDLGDRKIEVVEAGGHTAGSIVLIDHKTRIAYAGDACNGNTLLEFDDSLPVICYLENLLRLKRRQPEFDMMYGGHEIFDSTIIDEAIETAARVVAGTDDRAAAAGMTGREVFYAAAKAEGRYERADGKRFNMSYLPERITGEDVEKRAAIIY